MDRISNIYDVFAEVSRGSMAPDQALKQITPKNLAQFLTSSFSAEDSEQTPLAQGEGILEGDVSGVLVLSRDMAHIIADLNKCQSASNFDQQTASKFDQANQPFFLRCLNR